MVLVCAQRDGAQLVLDCIARGDAGKVNGPHTGNEISSSLFSIRVREEGGEGEERKRERKRDTQRVKARNGIVNAHAHTHTQIEKHINTVEPPYYDFEKARGLYTDMNI